MTDLKTLKELVLDHMDDSISETTLRREAIAWIKNIQRTSMNGGLYIQVSLPNGKILEENPYDDSSEFIGGIKVLSAFFNLTEADLK